MNCLRHLFGSLTLLVLCASLVHAQAPAKKSEPQKVSPALPDEMVKLFDWRSIGPANMSGRITALAVYEKDPCIWWAATASGGLLKTTNNGVTFEHQFDDQATVSIGDVQVSQSNPDIVWVGTGEANPRNSSSWGDGVYKSTDGGKTWKNMGLKKAFQIGRLALHPTDPNIVYVGVLGRLWGESEERGLYKTTDGGKKWKRVLFVDDKTGVVDVQMDPQDPKRLYVATYERKRDGFDGNDPIKKYGDGSGIYRTEDAGESFQKLSNGLPTCKLGRVGLSIYRKDPSHVYAIIESEKIGQMPPDLAYAGLSGADADAGAKITAVTKDGPSDKAGVKKDDIVLTVNGELIHGYNDLLKAIRNGAEGDVLNLTCSRERKSVECKLTLGKRPERPTGGQRGQQGRGQQGRGQQGRGQQAGGAGRPAAGSGGRGGPTRNEFTGTLGGQSANRQELQGPQGHEYGGIYLSKDRGETWTRINTLNPRPMYYSQIRVDPTDNQFLYVCGTRLYKSKDGGQTFTNDGGSDGIHVDHHALWVDPKDGRHMLLGNDGGIHASFDRMVHWDHFNHVAIGQFYHVGISKNRDYHVYGGLQDNGSWGGPSRSRLGRGPVNTDWYRVGSGDGFICLVDPHDRNQIYFESQNGGMGRIHLETGERGFFKPRRRGGAPYRFNWKTPFILSPHNPKIHYSAGDHVFRSVFKGDSVKAISPSITNTDKGAGSALAESPVEEGVLYVGTTDGALWATRDGGQTWVNLFTEPEKIATKPANAENVTPSGRPTRPGGTGGGGRSGSGRPGSGRPGSGRPGGGRSGFNPAQLVQRLLEADANADGILQAEEIPERMQRFIDRFDTNRDGSLDKKELAAIGRPPMPESGAPPADDKPTSAKPPESKESGDSDNQPPVSKEPTDAQKLPPAPKPDVKEAKPAKPPKKDPNADSLGRVRLLPNLRRDNVGLPQNVNSPDAASSLHLVGRFQVAEKKDTEKKDTEKKDTEKKDTEKKDTEKKDTEKKDTEKKDTEKKDTEKKDTEKKDIEKKDIEKKDIEKKDTEKKDTEKKDTEKKDTEKKDTEKKDTEKKDTEKKDTEKKDTEKKDTEKKDTEKKDAEKKDTDETKKTDPKSEPAKSDQPTDRVSGRWTGKFVNSNFSGEFTLQLKMEKDQITGTYSSPRAEGSIQRGELKGDQLTLHAVTGAEIVFKGTLGKDTYEGQLRVNEGEFEVQFEAKRSTETAEADTGQPIKELVPDPRWVSSLEASRFKPGRCYMTLDGHRSDDDEPYVFVTENYGRSWTSLRGNLPKTAGTTRVIREDVINQNVLFLGCEFSCWVSIDRGRSWTKLNNGDLPTVAIHEFAIHPTAGEMVAATHGRSLWICDIAALRQLSKESLAAAATLYKPQSAIRWRNRPSVGSSGTRAFVGENPAGGAKIYYSLGQSARSVNLKITNLQGETLVDIDAIADQRGEDDRTPAIEKGLGAGLHMFNWNLARQSRGQRGPGNRFRGTVAPGTYLVTLTVDGKIHTQPLAVEQDPDYAPPVTTDEEYELMKTMAGAYKKRLSEEPLQQRDD